MDIMSYRLEMAIDYNGHTKAISESHQKKNMYIFSKL